MADHRILFLSLTCDVGSDRLVAELGRAGAACAVLAPAGAYAALPRCVERRFPLPGRLGAVARSMVLRSRLAAAVRAWDPTAVVPLDELAALLLRGIAAEKRTPLPLRALLIRSLGRVDDLAALRCRVPLMELAVELGIAVPPFFAVPGPTGQPLPFPLVIKRDHSSGSGGVIIADDAAALGAALRTAGSKHRYKRALAHLAGFDHGDGAILVQRFVPGRLAMHTAVAQEGRTIDGVSVLALRCHPEKRSSTVLAPIEQPAMAEAAAALIAALGCSGFVSFDFMLDADDKPWLIEMNARPIGSTHLGRRFGHDLAAAFITGERSPAVATGPCSAVALFPKELERDPDFAPEADLHHDVPWDEPAVLAAYLACLAELHPSHADRLRRQFGPTPTCPAEPVRRFPAEWSQA